MKKWIVLWLAALLALLACAAFAEGGIASLEQLNAPGVKVGIWQGSAGESVVREQLPRAEMVYFNDTATAYLAVAQGKVDAFVYDYNQMRIAIESGVEGVHLLDETMGELVRIAVGISPATKIPELEDQLNRFIGEVRADGTLEDMYRRWVVDGNAQMPDIALPEKPERRLVVGTSGIVPPYSYYKGTELTGYDIELARRFAAWLGTDLQLKVYDYGAIIAAAASGDVDCVMANLNITPERAEALAFSDPLYEERLGVMVKGDASAMGDAPAAASVSAGAAPAYAAYNGRRIGVLTGPLMEDVAHEYFPDSEYLLFNTYPDCTRRSCPGRSTPTWATSRGSRPSTRSSPKSITSTSASPRTTTASPSERTTPRAPRCARS